MLVHCVYKCGKSGRNCLLGQLKQFWSAGAELPLSTPAGAMAADLSDRKAAWRRLVARPDAPPQFFKTFAANGLLRDTASATAFRRVRFASAEYLPQSVPPQGGRA